MNRPVRESSLNQYIKTVKMLHKRADSNKLSDLLEFIKMSDVKKSTKASHLNSIIGLQKHDPSTYGDGSLAKISDYRDRIGLEVKNLNNESNVKENQKEVMDTLTWDEIVLDVSNERNQLDDDFKRLEDYIILKILISVQIRNDLIDAKIFTKLADYKKYNGNKIYIPKTGEVSITISEHKTSGSSGSIVLELDIDTSSLIRKLVKEDPTRKYLIVNNKRNPMSSSAFTHRVNSITQRILGRPISTTLIRKLYLTDKYGDDNKERKEDSKRMGHSVQTANNYYIDNRK